MAKKLSAAEYKSRAIRHSGGKSMSSVIKEAPKPVKKPAK